MGEAGIGLARCDRMVRFLAALAVLLTACGGHVLMRNTVVMKISPTEANVCLHPGSFAVGDRVNVYQTKCQMGIDRTVGCHRYRVGEGTITRAINNHYAAIELATPSRLEEGFDVEVVR
jgi:hypothetical protein